MRQAVAYGISHVHRDTPVAIPGIVAPSVIYKGKRRYARFIVSVFVIENPPVILVVQELVVVIEQVLLILRVFVEFL